MSASPPVLMLVSFRKDGRHQSLFVTYGLLVPSWLRSYRLDGLTADAVAGFTLAAYMIPAAIGDATLANLPPQHGLYACLFAGLVFWLLCSSRQTSITVTSAISLLIGSSLGEMSGGDPLRHTTLAACTALMVAAFALVAWMLQAGVVVNFVSETVMVGFKAGVALHLSISQLPKIFGVQGGHGDFWERLGVFLGNLDQTNFRALLLGLGAFSLLLLGKSYLKHKPVALFVMVGGILIASLSALGDHGVKMLGEVPAGLPQLGLPAVSRDDVNQLLPLAMACFLLGAVETVAIGRMMAQKHNYRFDTNREFLALASSNLFSGLGQGYPISGGMSQSLVNESAGARTPISGLVASLVILIVALFFTGLFRKLPEPVLGAIVLAAVTGLIHASAFHRIWRFSRGEFAVAMAATAGVLGSGLLRGVLVGAVISLLLLLRRAARPHLVELARVPGADVFADVARHPENERVPGVLVVRCEAALLYFNVEHIRDQLFTIIKQRGGELKRVVFSLGATPFVDLAGAELLIELCEKLRHQGVDLRLAETHGPIRDGLRRLDFESLYGPLEANETVVHAVQRPFHQTTPDASLRKPD